MVGSCEGSESVYDNMNNVINNVTAASCVGVIIAPVTYSLATPSGGSILSGREHINYESTINKHSTVALPSTPTTAAPLRCCSVSSGRYTH